MADKHNGETENRGAPCNLTQRSKVSRQLAELNVVRTEASTDNPLSIDENKTAAVVVMGKYCNTGNVVSLSSASMKEKLQDKSLRVLSSLRLCVRLEVSLSAQHGVDDLLHENIRLPGAARGGEADIGGEYRTPKHNLAFVVASLAELGQINMHVPRGEITFKLQTPHISTGTQVTRTPCCLQPEAARAPPVRMPRSPEPHKEPRGRVCHLISLRYSVVVFPWLPKSVCGYVRSLPTYSTPRSRSGCGSVAAAWRSSPAAESATSSGRNTRTSFLRGTPTPTSIGLLGLLVTLPVGLLPRQHLFCAEDDDFYSYHDGLMFVINAYLPNKADVVSLRVALPVN
ncbi:hypothetical protein D9C73_010419 [Collichthys lucidus]|uniref:Uncharacterized protein n=1 Tax=Collichthys lucidus TaxID=240159 RepID=A0A4U5UMA3_COLLU|nr:hypothetical protein D9C73_010419 [Collichthys lucidus]